MNREFLKSLGVADEAIEKIMAEHGKTVEKFKNDAEDLKTKATEITNLKEQLKTANKQISDFKDMDIDSIKKSAEEYKAKAEEAERNSKAEIDKLKFDFALDGELSTAKAKNILKGSIDMIADVRLYDFEFNLLHIEHNIVSSNWTVKYNAIGTYEGHFSINSDIVERALNNKYLVVVQGDYQAIVTGKQIQGDEFVLYGRTCNWILSRRVTPNFVTSDAPSTNVELMARWIVQSAFSDVSNFKLGEIIGTANINNFWRNTYNPTSEVVIDCLANAELGHNVVYDRRNKQWVFNVLQGKSIPIIVSKGNKNAYNMGYEEDLQNYYTSGYYEQEQEEDADGNIPDPVWRCITKDSEDGIYRWDCVLSDNGESAARSSLKNKTWSKSINTKTNGLVHGKDYQLGDIVRVQSEWGKYRQTAKKRIIGVNLWYENNNIGQEPVFED